MEYNLNNLVKDTPVIALETSLEGLEELSPKDIISSLGEKRLFGLYLGGFFPAVVREDDRIIIYIIPPPTFFVTSKDELKVKNRILSRALFLEKLRAILDIKEELKEEEHIRVLDVIGECVIKELTMSDLKESYPKIYDTTLTFSASMSNIRSRSNVRIVPRTGIVELEGNELVARIYYASYYPGEYQRVYIYTYVVDGGILTRRREETGMIRREAYDKNTNTQGLLIDGYGRRIEVEKVSRIHIRRLSKIPERSYRKTDLIKVKRLASNKYVEFVLVRWKYNPTPTLVDEKTYVAIPLPPRRIPKKRINILEVRQG